MRWTEEQYNEWLLKERAQGNATQRVYVPVVRDVPPQRTIAQEAERTFDTGALVPYIAPDGVLSEAQHQSAIFRWARANVGVLPELELMFHPANESKRSPRYGAQKKREGMKRGVPDILLPVPNSKGFVGLAIELKRIDKRGRKTKVRPEQDAWLGRLRSYHWRAEVCYGAADAIGVILDYLGAG